MTRRYHARSSRAKFKRTIRKGPKVRDSSDISYSAAPSLGSPEKRHFLDFPNEIIGSVLSWVHEVSKSDPRTGKRLSTTLCLINHRVCEVALKTPVLWATIHTSCFSWRERHEIELLLSIDRSQIDRHLKLSGLHPLDITLNFWEIGWDAMEESTALIQADVMHDFLSLLLPHAPRWERFTLRVDAWVTMHAFLSGTQDVSDMPLLEHLELVRCNHGYASPGASFEPRENNLMTHLSLFDGLSLPRLSSAVLDGVHVKWEDSSLRGLDRLKLSYHAEEVMPSWENFKDILNGCPDLSDLALVGWGPLELAVLRDQEMAASPPKDMDVLVLPNLQHLRVGVIDEASSVALLQRLQAPNLTKLMLTDVSNVTSRSMPHPRIDLSPVVQHLIAENGVSSPTIPLRQLEELSLHYVDISPRLLSNLLEQTSALQVLRLDRGDCPIGQDWTNTQTHQIDGRQVTCALPIDMPHVMHMPSVFRDLQMRANRLGSKSQLHEVNFMTRKSDKDGYRLRSLAVPLYEQANVWVDFHDFEGFWAPFEIE